MDPRGVDLPLVITTLASLAGVEIEVDAEVKAASIQLVLELDGEVATGRILELIYDLYDLKGTVEEDRLRISLDPERGHQPLLRLFDARDLIGGMPDAGGVAKLWSSMADRSAFSGCSRRKRSSSASDGTLTHGRPWIPPFPGWAEGPDS